MKSTSKNMPHNGDLLKKYTKESGETKIILSRKMGYSDSMLSRLTETYSIRTHIWWELGLVINRNLFAEFAERFPVKYKSAREMEIETELEKVKTELEIYKRIVGKQI